MATLMTASGPIEVAGAVAAVMVPEAAYQQAVAERDAAEDLAADLLMLLVVTLRDLELLRLRSGVRGVA